MALAVPTIEMAYLDDGCLCVRLPKDENRFGQVAVQLIEAVLNKLSLPCRKEMWRKDTNLETWPGIRDRGNGFGNFGDDLIGFKVFVLFLFAVCSCRRCCLSCINP